MSNHDPRFDQPLWVSIEVSDLGFVTYTHLDADCPTQDTADAFYPVDGYDERGMIACFDCFPVDVIADGAIDLVHEFAARNGTGSGRPAPKPISEKQLRLLRTLIAEKRYTLEQVIVLADLKGETFATDADLTAKAASALIDLLMTLPPNPEVSGPEPAAEADVEALCASCVDSGRKFTTDDMSPDLVAFATGWAQDYSGDFGFMVDMARAATDRGTLSPGQAKGVMNCYLADFRRRPAPAAEGAPQLDLTDIPAGSYGVPGGTTRLKVRIRHVTKGRWDGWTFVDDGAAYGHRRNYGKQAPGSHYQGDIVDALEAIVADPAAAAKAYGDLTGCCSRCNRVLEDEASVESGLGPICRSKVGW